MLEAQKLLFQVQVTNANTTLYTPDTKPDSAQVRIDTLTICNTDTSARTLTIDLVPSGGSAGVSRRLFSAAAIPASTTWNVNGPIYLAVGTTLQGLASVTNVVTLTAHGAVIT